MTQEEQTLPFHRPRPPPWTGALPARAALHREIDGRGDVVSIVRVPRHRCPRPQRGRPPLWWVKADLKGVMMSVVEDRASEVLRQVDRYWRGIGMPEPARCARRAALSEQLTADLERDPQRIPEIDALALAERWAGRDVRSRVRWACYQGAAGIFAYAGAAALMFEWLPGRELSWTVIAIPAVAFVVVSGKAVWRATHAPADRNQRLRSMWIVGALLVALATTFAPRLADESAFPVWTSLALITAGVAFGVLARRVQATWT